MISMADAYMDELQCELDTLEKARKLILRKVVERNETYDERMKDPTYLTVLLDAGRIVCEAQKSCEDCPMCTGYSFACKRGCKAKMLYMDIAELAMKTHVTFLDEDCTLLEYLIFQRKYVLGAFISGKEQRYNDNLEGKDFKERSRNMEYMKAFGVVGSSFCSRQGACDNCPLCDKRVEFAMRRCIVDGVYVDIVEHMIKHDGVQNAHIVGRAE